MDSIALQLERHLITSADVCRRRIATGLQAMRFSIDLARGSVIEAHAGSPWLPRFGATGSRPVRIRITVLQHGLATKVSIRITECEQLILDPTAAKENYSRIFAEVYENIDLTLRTLDPDMVVEDAPTLSIAPELEALTGKARGLVNRISRFGTRRQDTKGQQGVVITTADAYALLSYEQLNALFMISTIVSADPAIPATLVPDLASLHTDLSRLLLPPRLTFELRVSERVKAVMDFLHRQFVVRQKLPIRELQQCRDCGLEKVVNPQLRQGGLTEIANQRFVLGLAGVAVGLAVSPLSAIGAATRLAGLRPAKSRFVCQRCQGTNVDVGLATICPRCQTILKETVLRHCTAASCGHNLLEGTDELTLWKPGRPPASEEGIGQPFVASLNSEGPTQLTPSNSDMETETQSAHASAAPAGWYPDPSGRHAFRWFDGEWRSAVSDEDSVTYD